MDGEVIILSHPTVQHDAPTRSKSALSNKRIQPGASRSTGTGSKVKAQNKSRVLPVIIKFPSGRVATHFGASLPLGRSISACGPLSSLQK